MKFKIGDKVRKWKSFGEELGKEIWIVSSVTKNPSSQTGILLDVYIPMCPHCLHPERKIMGYDSAWFQKVEE